MFHSRVDHWLQSDTTCVVDLYIVTRVLLSYVLAMLVCQHNPARQPSVARFLLHQQLCYRLVRHANAVAMLKALRLARYRVIGAAVRSSLIVGFGAMQHDVSPG